MSTTALIAGSPTGDCCRVANVRFDLEPNERNTHVSRSDLRGAAISARVRGKSFVYHAGRIWIVTVAGVLMETDLNDHVLSAEFKAWAART